ncbi:RNA 2'-phosphotransferase [Hymenobacter properus]|uniref:Probable RNA 2'-phosphotransferase n=1 Tax=Hymenobacter properus TaxID=2791026 RepID=A0A931BCX2_9BACT|nr:RNA 2'-phosphotransferase [Hymenobacter properus]MBF9140989.1 RNA 2'-phosphotransferase [Hymenobacter properus]MBR7719798.1 RNA 2'-phosphotransferase [Microvirga sp. SRT04]
MDSKQTTRLSKFLSLHLRHRPDAIGLTLQEGGWVSVAELLAACAAHGTPISPTQLAEIVANNDKKRFAFDASGTQIRAQQGHSVEVNLQLTPAVPPPVLYHGTAPAALPAIRREGLQKMQRHHVHLSPDEETARRVGARRGQPHILTVDAAGLHAGGALFYESGNGVWLVDAVPPQYLGGL